MQKLQRIGDVWKVTDKNSCPEVFLKKCDPKNIPKFKGKL